jgi:hypothetical protein
VNLSFLPQTETLTSGAEATTRWVTRGAWRDKVVDVTSAVPCPVPGHALEVVHYGGEQDGVAYHVCPTGFLICYACGGSAQEPEPYSCTANEGAS